LANAGQAIEGTGVIRFGSRLDGEQVHVWVEDSGRGIREEDKAKILNKGFTTKPVGVGTGLGLAIVKQIVTEAHQGSIDFESEVGKGTTFHVRLPVHQSREGA